MSREADNLVTWFCMFAGFLLLIIFAGESIEFQKRCESQCDKTRAITPIIDLQEACFCDEGHGKWRREFLK